MQVAEVIDYAPHIERLKHLIREVNDKANERNQAEAEDAALRLLAEAKLLVHAVRDPQ
jgi:hypothetical protein